MIDVFYTYGRYLLLLGVVALYPHILQAQTGSASVTVIRSDNQKPLPDAIIRVVPLDQIKAKIKERAGLTDAEGVYSFSMDLPVLIQISHLGFLSITDTLYIPGNRTYTLMATSQSIQDVVVTGQYAPNSVQKSVYEVKVISSDVIRAKGANNLRDALQNELSIDLGQDQVFGSGVGINGISGEGVKIMVDGVPIVGRLDGKLDLSQININNIERIEIVEGPLSVLYGTDAMGGVVNIITKTFQTEKVNLNLKGYYESVGQYNVELNTGFAFRKNQIYLSGGRYFFDGYSASDSLQRFQEWKPKEQYFADGKYMHTGNRFRLSLTGSFFRELLLNRGTPKRTLDDNGNSWTFKAEDFHYLTFRPRVAASAMYKFKENTQLDALLSYSGFFRFGNKYSKNLVTQKETLVPDPNEQDTAVYHLILFRGTYGMPAWKDKLYFMFGTEVNQEYTTQKRIEGREQKSGDYAVYGNIRLTLIKGLDIQPAIRFSYNTRFQVPLIPSINLKYDFKEIVVLRASYGRGYRAPSLKELYMVFFDSNHSLKGNENLKPENGDNVNVSLNYVQQLKKNHKLNFTVSGFYNHIKDKIDWLIIPGNGFETDTFQYFNLKRYVTYGGEASVGYTWKRFSLNSSVQLTRYQLSLRSSGANPVKMVSPDFTATVSYRIPVADIGVNVFYKFNGPKPLFSINNSIQTGARQAYHSLDVSLSRNFWKNRIQVIIGGRNLVGVTNVIADNVSGVGHNFGSNSVNVGWGRTFYSSLVLHFSK